MSVDTLLGGIAAIVFVYDVAYTEVLVLPRRVGGGGIQFGRYAATRRVVHEVFAVVEVDELVVVSATVIAHVNTADNVEHVAVLEIELFLIRRNEAVPLMLVYTYRHCIH